MRKTLATLAATVACLGAAAGTATADVPAFHTQTHAYGTPVSLSYGWMCKPAYASGVYVPGMYYFVDGCTTNRVVCPNYGKRCRITYRDTYFDTNSHIGHRVTENARMRWFDKYGRQYAHADASCAGIDICNMWDKTGIGYLSPGESASAQCNGTRQSGVGFNTAQPVCVIKLDTI